MGKNFGELKQALQDWLSIDQEDGDERLPDAVAGDILNIVSRYYCRIRESKLAEDSTVFNVAAYTPDYDVPTGFSKPRKIWYLEPSTNKVRVVEQLNKDKFDELYPFSSLFTINGAVALILAGGGPLLLEGGGTLDLTDFPDITNSLGSPTHYTIWRNKVILGPCPDSAIITFIDFWKLLPDLVDDDDENRFTDEAWEYLLFNGLVKAAEFGYDVESERLAVWVKEAKMQEDALDIEDTRQRTTGRRSQSTEPG